MWAGYAEGCLLQMQVVSAQLLELRMQAVGLLLLEYQIGDTLMNTTGLGHVGTNSIDLCCCVVCL